MDIKDKTRDFVKALAKELYNQVPPLHSLNVCLYLIHRYLAQHSNETFPLPFGPERQWERGQEIPELQDLSLTLEQMLHDGELKAEEGSDFFKLNNEETELSELEKEAVTYASHWTLGKSYEQARDWITKHSNTWRQEWCYIEPGMDLQPWDQWCADQKRIRKVREEVDQVVNRLIAEGKI